MQTSNPTLASNPFANLRVGSREDTMTMSGTVTKTAMLLLITILSAGYIWFQFFKSGQNVQAVTPWMLGGAIAGLVVALVTVFKPAWSAITAPLYALVEGLFIGGMSAVMEASFPGIVIQATILTFGTFLAMLAAYQSGFIRATESFKLGIVAATGGIAVVYLISMGLSFFGIQMPFIYGNGLFGIGFSIFVVIIAALNFVLDFDFIEQASRRNVPKYMEWYGAFALMVTLIWLYIEFLRLLAKLRSRD